MKIKFFDERAQEGETFHYEKRHRPVCRASQSRQRSDSRSNSHSAASTMACTVDEIALQYANEYTENVHCYVNNIHTDGRRNSPVSVSARP